MTWLIKLLETKQKEIYKYKIICLKNKNYTDYNNLNKRDKQITFVIDLIAGFNYMKNKKIF